MKLNELPKIQQRSKKRLGRGLGSGKGKTGGRGTKGHKARSNTPLGFIGGTLPLYKRLPFRRGLGNPKRSALTLPVSLVKLAVFPAGTVVDLQSLITSGVIKEQDTKMKTIKILGTGEITKALTVKLAVSKSAATKIEQAGGKVIRE